jgi:hypothetical protein
MQEYTKQVKQTLLQIVIFTLVLTSGALILNRSAVVPGLLIGTTASIIYFLLLCYRVKRSAELSPQKAVAYMRYGWVIRLFFVVLSLSLCFKLEQIDYIAALLGLFSLHIVVILNACVMLVKLRFHSE